MKISDIQTTSATKCDPGKRLAFVLRHRHISPFATSSLVNSRRKICVRGEAGSVRGSIYPFQAHIRSDPADRSSSGYVHNRLRQTGDNSSPPSIIIAAHRPRPSPSRSAAKPFQFGSHPFSDTAPPCQHLRKSDKAAPCTANVPVLPCWERLPGYQHCVAACLASGKPFAARYRMIVLDAGWLKVGTPFSIHTNLSPYQHTLRL